MVNEPGICTNCGEIAPWVLLNASEGLCPICDWRKRHPDDRGIPVAGVALQYQPDRADVQYQEAQLWAASAKKAKEAALAKAKRAADARRHKEVADRVFDESERRRAERELERKDRRRRVERGDPVPVKAKKKSNKEKTPSALNPWEHADDPSSNIPAPVDPDAVLCNACNQYVNANGFCGCHR